MPFTNEQRINMLASTIHRNISVLTVLVATCLFYFLRMPNEFYYPQFVIEDSNIFFANARESAWGHLFQPYAGYQHLTQRLIAAIGSYLPVRLVPTFYLYASLFGLLAVAILILDRRIVLPAKWLLAIALTLAHGSGEVYGNITNLQWILPLGVMAIVFTKGAPRTLAGKVAETTFLVLASFTGPFSIFLLPAFAIKVLATQRSFIGALLRKHLDIELFQARRYLLLQTAVVTAGAVTQAVCIAQLPSILGTAESASANYGFATVVTFRVLTSMFGKPVVTPLAWWEIVAAFSVITLLTVQMIRKPLARFPAIVLIGVSTTILATVYIRFRHNLPILSIVPNGDRYFYIPKVSLLWLLIIVSPLAKARVLLLLVGVASSPFQRPRLIDHHWPHYAHLLQQGIQVQVPFNGDNNSLWLKIFPGKPFDPAMATPSGWNEARYLSEHPDVAAAVRDGRLVSGYHHFFLAGATERRRGGLPAPR